MNRRNCVMHILKTRKREWQRCGRGVDKIRLKDIGNGFFYCLVLFSIIVLVKICISFAMKISQFVVKSE
jgi:hypothetical protein